MKCSFCGVEVAGDASAPAALTIITNTPDEAMTNFVCLFGVYDQRARAIFEICGACLVDRLKGSWRDHPPMF